MYVMCPSRDWT